MGNKKKLYIVLVIIFVVVALLVSCVDETKNTDQKSVSHTAKKIAVKKVKTVKKPDLITVKRKINTTQKPDFSAIKDYKERKITFINYVLGGIDVANKKICADRNEIENLKSHLTKDNKLPASQKAKLDAFAKQYKVNTKFQDNVIIRELLTRVGTAPQSFIIAQAALESGWGTSRFAKDYNNYFGLHCFRDGCGPKAKNANVYLEKFNNIGESILGYYNRLNTGSYFQYFRSVRAQPNQNVEKLVTTLGNYSELGSDVYESRLIDVINHNNLTKYDTPTCNLSK